MPNRRWALSAETVTAVGAVFTALVALAVGVWDNVETRRQNRLSVVPSLSITTTLTTNDADSADVGVITIRNEGVGPAVIRSVRIRVREADGRERAFESWGSARDAIEALGVSVTGRAELGPGAVLGTGRELDLATLEARSPVRRIGDGEDHPFDRVLEGLRVQIEYASVYGDLFVEESGEG